jgi:hypothetical protein
MIKPKSHSVHSSLKWIPESFAFPIPDSYEWTGMKIVMVRSLSIAINGLPPIKHLHLQSPVYYVIFHPTQDYAEYRCLINYPTLRQAKKLAESYYTKWSES